MYRLSSIISLIILVFVYGCKKDDEEPAAVDPDNASPEVHLSFEGIYNYQIMESDTLILSAQANDSDGVVSKVKFFLGETLIGEDSQVPFRHTWISTEPGQFIFSAVAFDDDGAWTQSSSREIIVLSGTIPYITIQDPHNGNSIREGSSVAVRTTAWDFDGEIVKIEVFFNDGLLNTHLNVESTLDSIHNVQLGEFRITAIAYDDDGHISEPVEIEAPISPNNPPTAEISQYFSLYDLWAGETIRLDVDVEDWDGQVVKIELYANETMVAADSNSYYYHDIYWYDIESGSFDLQLRAYDNSGGIGYSNILSVDVKQRLALNGRIVCFSWGASPDVAYGLVSETNELVVMNPLAQELVNTYTLPYSHPLRMQYSEQDDKLYIVSYYTGAVSVFDVATENFTEWQFSSSADGRDISISPQYRRVFVAASDGMYMMDMDNGSVLDENHAYECSSIASMHNQQKIFANFDTWGGPLQRWSFDGSEFTYEQQMDDGSNDCNKIIVPSDDSKIIYPCIGYGSQITALEPLNLENTLGVFQGGSYRDFCISKDADYFYMVGWDGLAAFNANTYVKLVEDKFGIMNIDDSETTVGVNSDGSVVMVFSCDDYYEEDYYVHFLEKNW